MHLQAFVLNDDFIAEVWKKLNTINQSVKVDKDFTNYIEECNLFSFHHLTAIIETAYWVSHTTEELNPSKVSLILSKPKQDLHTFRFDNPVPLTQNHLIKLGAALDSGFSDICIWFGEDGGLHIWGFKMRSSNHVTTNLRVIILRPGSVVITCYGRSVAALTDNRGVLLNPELLYKVLLPTIVSNDTFSDYSEQHLLKIAVLLQISQAMRNHQQGGTLLIVPDDERWKKSIKQPVSYSGRADLLSTDQKSLPSPARAVRNHPGSMLKMFVNPENKEIADFRLKIIEQCDRIGRLTATDGALVMNNERYVLCFGGKIRAINALAGSTKIQVVRPIENDIKSNRIFAEFGGTRHQSAAQFIHDQPGSIAIVASQDGNVTFITNDTSSGELVSVHDADLVLMHEGILGVFWSLHQLLDD